MGQTAGKTPPSIPLDELVYSYRILIDTNMLIGWQVGGLVGELRRRRRRAIVPLSVVRELERLSQSDADASRAADALRRVHQLVQEGVFELRGEPDDPQHADDLFVEVCRKFADRKKICVLTRDRKLENRLRSVHHTNILVLDTLPKQRTHVPRFKLATEVTQVPEQAVRIDSVPCLGETCYEQGKNKELILREKIAEGGEGIVYKINASTACKIYHPRRLTQRRLEKLRRMTERPLRISGVCWPRKLVCNDRKQVVGYTMPLAAGTPVQRCVHIRPLLEQNFPHWTREHLVSLARRWLEKVVLLHRENVLLGDINPQNFLVVDETRIWFVDCDSYQIEEFPCPVGMVTFTPPELQGKNFATFLRSFEHENFAVATFLFMLLLPGKPPYSHTGGEDPGTNIRQGKFPYTPPGANKKRKKDKVPLGAWRYMWSHLPDYLQTAFYETFTATDSQQRLATRQWLELLDRYQEDLIHNRLCPTGEGLQIYPQRLRVRCERTHDNRIRTNCAACGKRLEYTEQFFQENFLARCEGYCAQCRKTKRQESSSANRQKNTPPQQTQTTSTPSTHATSHATPSTSSSPSSVPDDAQVWVGLLGIFGLLLLLGLFFFGCEEEPDPTPKVQVTFSFYLSISSDFSPDMIGSTGEYYLILQQGDQEWYVPDGDEVAIVSGKRAHLGNLVLQVPVSSTLTYTATVYEEDLLADDEVGSGSWPLEADPRYPVSHRKIYLPGGTTLEITARITKDKKDKKKAD